MKLRTVLGIILAVNIGIVAIGGFFIAYMSTIDPVVRPPIVQRNDIQNLQTDHDVYRRGDIIRVHLSYCKNRQYDAWTQWRLINQTDVPFPEKYSSISPIGCFEVWAPIAQIPMNTSLGEHHLQGKNRVKANRYSIIYFDFKSEKFEVVQ